MKHAIPPLIMVSAVLAGGVGFAELTTPGSERGAGIRRVPVEQLTLACPQPSAPQLGGTSWVAAAVAPEASRGGSATLTELTAKSRERASLDTPGQVKRLTASSDLPPLLGRASGGLAPGFTAQQLTRSDGRGWSGTPCTSPSNDFWFAAAGSDQGQHAQLFLTNSESAPARVDVSLYGPGGPVPTPAGRDIEVPAHSQERVALSALRPGVTRAAVHVVVRAGVVAAALSYEEIDGLDQVGMDWLPESAPPARRLLVPGVPPGSGKQQLYLVRRGREEANVTLRMLGKDGDFSPAGAESVQVRPGRVKQVDLSSVTAGEAVAVSVEADRPVVAGMRVLRGEDETDTGYLAAVPPIRQSATVLDNRTTGDVSSWLLLSCVGKSSTVEVSTFAGKQPKTRTVDIPAGATVRVKLKPPGGGGRYAARVQPNVESGRVYGARYLVEKTSAGSMFTVQPLREDETTVVVPHVANDLSAGVGRGTDQ
ncbi:MAG: DUF5719 family protein [Carbonactinosporaceae bacterium]